MDFQNLLAQNGGFVAKWERGGAMMTTQRTRSYFLGLLAVCHFWRKLIKKCDRESADRQTDGRTHAQTERQTELIICPMLYAIYFILFYLFIYLFIIERTKTRAPAHIYLSIANFKCIP